MAVNVSNTAQTVTHLGWQGPSGPGARIQQRYPFGHLALDVHLYDTTGADHALSVPSWYSGGRRQVAVTYDKTSGDARAYIDSILRAQADLGIFEPRTGSDLYLGHTPGEGVFFKGQLDEVSLYNRVLSPAEIQTLFNAGSAGKCPVHRNEPPGVFAGADKTVYLPNSTTLLGSAFDDGRPAGGTFSVYWTYRRGPAPVLFSSTNQPVVQVSFDSPGAYRFDLTAADGEFTIADRATVTVLPDPRTPPSITITSPAAHALEGMTQLEDLGLVSTPVKNLRGLEKLRSLKYFSVNRAPLVSLEEIESLSLLEELSLVLLSKLESIAPLGSLTRLKSLGVVCCRKVRDISALGCLENLSHLFLEDRGEVESFNPLKTLKKLEELSFYGTTKILNGDLSVLVDLPALRKTPFKQWSHYSMTLAEISEARVRRGFHALK